MDKNDFLGLARNEFRQVKECPVRKWLQGNAAKEMQRRLAVELLKK